MTPTIRVRRIGEHTLPVPSRATPFAAGLDLRNAGPRVMLFALGEAKEEKIRTGFAFAIPPGYCGLVLGRSGLAFNDGVVAFHIGIAQLVIAPVSLASCEEGDLDETTRGAGGFGSTGVK